MKTENKLKNAFNLIELSIIIALVAIVGTVTTFLCLELCKTASKNAKQVAFMQDVASVQSAFETYVGYDVSCNKILECSTHGETSNVLLSEEEHYNPVYFDTQTKQLKINYSFLSFKTVENITFTVLKNQSVNDFLIVCTLTVDGNYANDGSNTFIFTVNPFVLETVNINSGGADNA